MLLAVTFGEFISRWNVIVGIILASLGLAIIFLARNFTKTMEKTDAISKSSKYYIVAKIVGIVVLLIGMVFIAFPR